MWPKSSGFTISCTYHTDAAQIGKLLFWFSLLPVRCALGHAADRVRTRLQGGTSHRGMPRARQGRGGLGELSGANVARLASSSGLVAHRHLVPNSGSQAGKKNGPQRSPCRSSAGASLACYNKRLVATNPILSAAPRHAVSNATNKRASITGKNTNACRHYGLGNANDGNSRGRQVSH